jgi:hypothetical protein
MTGFIGISITVTFSYNTSQSILSAEASPRSTTDSKRPSLSPINLRHGPRTENTLRTPYSSNSSNVIEVCLRCRYTETVAFYCCLLIRWRENVFSDPLPSDKYIGYNNKCRDLNHNKVFSKIVIKYQIP